MIINTKSKSFRPSQMVPYKSRDEQWIKDTVDYYIGLSGTNFPFRSDLDELENIHEATFDLKNYLDFRPPFLQKKDKLSKLENIRRTNYNNEKYNYKIKLIKPSTTYLVGEFTKRPQDYTVKVLNSDVESIRISRRNEELSSVLASRILQSLEGELNNPQISDEEKQKIIEETLAKYSPENWQDERAINGQTAVDIIIDEQKVMSKCTEGFHQFLKLGEIITFKNIVSGEVVYEFINPRNVRYDNSTKYIEDGEWQVIIDYKTFSEIVEEFYSEFTQAELKELEKRFDKDYTSKRSIRIEGSFRTDQLPVYRVFWKSKLKIGIVSYRDEYGEVQEREVDDEYKLDEEAGDISVEWYYVNEYWQSVRIEDDIYIATRPILNQRGSVDNPATVKSPVNGYKSFIGSLTELGKPFQILHSEMMNKFLDLLAKSKGVILDIDVTSKPDSFSTEEWFDLMFSHNIKLKSPKDGPRDNQHTSVIDATFTQAVKLLIDVMALIESQWDSVSGMNRQRRGQIYSSETVGGIERAVNQSSLSTEIYFYMYEQFIERELNGLLDYSRVAWINGKTGYKKVAETELVFAEIDGDQHASTNYGLYLSKSQSDIQKLNQFKEFAKELAATGKDPSVIAEIIDAKNMSKLKKKLREAEKAVRDYEKQVQESNLKLEQEKNNFELAKLDKELNAENANNIRDNITKILASKKDKDGNDRLDSDILEDIRRVMNTEEV